MRAVEAYRRGDFKQAVVDARGVLKKNPQSSAATRIVAQSLEAMQSPQALAWRRELDNLQSGDAENLLGLAATSIKTGDYESAARALKRIKPEDQKTARFHDLSAKLAQRKRDTAAAETHWNEAVRLEPANEDFRFGLASVQLDSREPATRAAALEALQKMAENPPQRLASLRVLVADSALYGEKSRTRQLAETLAADPAAEFADKLSCLTILRKAGEARATTYLAELQELAAPDKEQVYKLMSWMNENNLALVVIEWESRLPAEFTTQPPICATLADAYARAADWKGLKEKLEGATWPDMEFLRLAFLSRALERLNDPSAAGAAWNNALAIAQTRPDWLEVLGRVTRAWGWKQRAEETLWKLSATDRAPRWALDFLWSAALARQDTLKLYEASALLVKADPTNLVVRTQHIGLALLTGQTADGPAELAETLYQQNPQVISAATTYGLALFQQGRAAEAVAVMETFKPEELRAPQAAAYYAIYLAVAGQAERADESFQHGAKLSLLPEEKAIVGLLAPACRARVLDRGGDAFRSQAAWREALAAAGAHPERLEMLGKMALDWQWQPQAEALVLKLASLERCPGWAAQTLWTAVTKSGNSAEILRAGRLLAKVDPHNLSVRSRFLLVALLMGREVESAQREIAIFAREHAGNIEVATTSGLSLYQQGKAEEAVALMKTFPMEKLRDPAIALYPGIFLAATGRKDDAAPYLQIAANAPLLPEERVLLTKAQSDDVAPTPAPRPVVAAPAAPQAPVAAIDRTRRDTTQLFKEAREAFLADSKNVLARRNYVLLALLTGQSVDSARQLARALYKEQTGDATAAYIHGLSLHQQGKSEEAVKLIETLKPEQLREPLVALYYGHFLAGSERPEKAARSAEFLALAKQASLLREEEALLHSAK